LFYDLHFGCKGTKKSSDKHSLSAKKLKKESRNPDGVTAQLIVG
jgi:hypothetical protein